MSNTATYTATEAVAREIRGLLAKAGLTQKDVASILAITQAGVSDRLRGKQNFSLDELFTLAGALDLTVGDLLGNSIVSARVPEPSYIEGQGRIKRKVAPIGFVPNGATYQILSGEECALWGSNPRPADYQTQSPKTRHTAQQPAPHRGFYIALLLWMCNQSQHTEKRKPCFGNHIRATLRPGNSPPEKRTPRQKPVNIGFNTSRVHIRRPPP